MEVIPFVVNVSTVLVGIVGIVKIGLDVRGMPRVAQRNEYDFVHEFAERTGDDRAASYAKELGYRTLVNDDALTTEQRKAVLTLPNRVKSIQWYLKVRKLVTVQIGAPVLTWKKHRHSIAAYRRALMAVLFFVYVVLASAGLFAIFLPGQRTPWVALNQILNLPVWASLYLVLLASLCLFRSIQLKTAADLVKLASL